MRRHARRCASAFSFGERALFLAQRTPYALRWQAEVMTYNTFAMDEAQRLLESIGGLTATASSAVQVAAGMPAQLTQARVAALQDLFARTERERAAALRDMSARIELERRGTLEQMAAIIQKERSAILLEAGETLTVQRKAIFQDLVDVATRAEAKGRAWAGALLVVGSVLLAVLLLALFGLLLLYRRLLQRMERHPPR
jgi:hypothetical protein